MADTHAASAAARTPGAGRKLSAGERTKARILAAATELFSESGSHSVSLRDIAAKVGLSHVGVLHHFENKDALLLAVLTQRDAELAPGLYRSAAGAAPPFLSRSPERVMMVFAGIVCSVRRNANARVIVSLFARISAESTDPEQPAHSHFQHRYRSLLDLLTEAFETRFRAVPPPIPITARIAAQHAVALMDGLQLQWLLATSPADVPEKVEGTNMAEGMEAYLELLGIVPTEEDFRAFDAYLASHGGSPSSTDTHGN